MAWLRLITVFTIMASSRCFAADIECEFYHELDEVGRCQFDSSSEYPYCMHEFNNGKSAICYGHEDESLECGLSKDIITVKSFVHEKGFLSRRQKEVSLTKDIFDSFEAHGGAKGNPVLNVSVIYEFSGSEDSAVWHSAFCQLRDQ